jgi:hypothetical protein
VPPPVGAAAVLGAAGSPLTALVSSFGGVRLERFGGITGFGMNRRVTMPWPVVQRFVVSQ